MTMRIPNNAPPLFQSDWQHAALKSTDGTRLSLDFQDVAVQADEFTAADVTANAWLNISNPAFGPSTKVSAVLIDKTQTPFAPHYPQSEDVHVVELQYAGDQRFTAPVPTMALNVMGAHYGERHAWQIAAVVDGDWKTDPVSGDHNFNVDPAKFETLTKAND
jgi:hypothetical protein